MRHVLFTLIAMFVIAIATPLHADEPVATIFEVSVDHGRSITLPGAASSVFVANPDIADIQVMSPTNVMIFGKRAGETTFMATDSRGANLAMHTIRVVQDLSGLRYELDAAIPGNKIRVQSVPNGIVMTGDAKDATTIADAHKLAQRYLGQGGDIINRVRVAGSNQVQIRVRFAEVQRNIDNTLGFNWSTLADISGATIGLFTGATTLTSGADITAAIRPDNATLNAKNNALGFHSAGHRLDVSGMIDALARDGLISILAEPTLTAMSGETASFLAGGEFPIAIPQGANSNQITVQFKTFGIQLAFTPTLVNDDRINLHVRPEVSQLSSENAITIGNTRIPGLATRRAETTVEVASGQSFAIAGLLDNNSNHVVDKYPLLGDIPVLGQLFRSDHYQSGQTELIVIITPYIVKPSNEQLALPTDGMSPPSDTDRFLKLRYSGSDPKGRAASGAPVGVMVDPSMPSNRDVRSDADDVLPVSVAPVSMNELEEPTNAPVEPVVTTSKKSPERTAASTPKTAHPTDVKTSATKPQPSVTATDEARAAPDVMQPAMTVAASPSNPAPAEVKMTTVPATIQSSSPAVDTTPVAITRRLISPARVDTKTAGGFMLE